MVHRIVNALMVASFLAAAVAYWFKDALPQPMHLNPELGEEPKQAATDEKPLDTVVNGVRYSVQPRFTYDRSSRARRPRGSTAHRSRTTTS